MRLARVIAFVIGLIAAAGICAGGAMAQTGAAALAAPFSSAQDKQAKPDGGALFKEHCSMCHISGGAKGNAAPAIEVLAQKTQEEILRALESGAMVIYGNRMAEAERRAVAAFLSSNTSNSAALAMANLCATKKPITSSGLQDPENWNGWGVDAVNSRYQAHTSISADNVAGLKLKWAFGIPDASTAYGQPTVVGGRAVFRLG